MKGRSNSVTTNSSPKDVMQAFKNFCKRRSKRAMSPKTLDRYEQINDALFRKYGLKLDSVDLIFLAFIYSLYFQDNLKFGTIL